MYASKMAPNVPVCNSFGSHAKPYIWSEMPIYNVYHCIEIIQIGIFPKLHKCIIKLLSLFQSASPLGHIEGNNCGLK